MNVRSAGFSKVHAVGLILVGFLAATLLLAPSRSEAAEEPFKIEFDQSAMQFGLLSDLPLGELATTGSLEGTIDENGKVVIPKGNFKLPEIGITDPVTVKLFMGIESEATGTFNRQTGELVLNAKAGVWLSANLPELLGALEGFGVDIGDQLGPLAGFVGSVKDLTCGFSPMDVTFTTGSTSLGAGAPFAAGPLGPGAITAEWSKLGPFAGKTKILVFDVCQAIRMYAPDLLEGALGGVLPEGLDLGGLDIESLLGLLDEPDLGPSSMTLTRSLDENRVPEPPVVKPKLKLSVTPKKRKVRSGGKTVFTVKVRNAGKGTARGVRVCLKTSGARTVNGKRCRTLGKVMAGATQTRRYRIKVGKKRRKSVKVRFLMRASNATRAESGAKLLIRRR